MSTRPGRWSPGATGDDASTAGPRAVAFRADAPIAGPRAVATGLAVLIHLAILSSAGSAVTRPTPPPAITEIELAAPPPPPPPPRPPEPPRTAAAEPRATTPAKTAAPRAARPARPARVLTAAGSAGDQPVDFATDPQGNPFAAQVVAAGAPAPGDVPPAPAPRGPAPARDRIAAPEDLTSIARLDARDPCTGFYPRGAAVDRGEAVLSVIVRPDGRAASAAVVSESPPGEGFGASARRCLLGQAFTAARDRGGRPVTAAATIRVRFSR